MGEGSQDSVSVALAGSGGSGVMTAGTMLLAAAARAGYYGMMVRTSGPQIRGGEAAALLRIAAHPVDGLDDTFHALVALDWGNVQRFVDEIPLSASSLVVGEEAEGEAPAGFLASGARPAAVPFRKTAKALAGAWPNMVALGFIGELIGLPAEAVQVGRARGPEESRRRGRHARRGRGRRDDGDRAGRALRAAAGASARGRALAGLRQRGGGLRCDPRRRALRGRLPDHARRPRCWNGWRPRSPASAARWCRPRTSSPRST